MKNLPIRGRILNVDWQMRDGKKNVWSMERGENRVGGKEAKQHEFVNKWRKNIKLSKQTITLTQFNVYGKNIKLTFQLRYI